VGAAKKAERKPEEELGEEARHCLRNIPEKPVCHQNPRTTDLMEPFDTLSQATNYRAHPNDAIH
jgi:hypothetical protein